MSKYRNSEIAEKVIDIVSSNLEKQIEKGFLKYKQILDECPDGRYNFNIMAIEELTDAVQYLLKENKRLEKQLRKEKKKNIHLEKLHLRNINFEDVEG